MWMWRARFGKYERSEVFERSERFERSEFAPSVRAKRETHVRAERGLARVERSERWEVGAKRVRAERKGKEIRRARRDSCPFARDAKLSCHVDLAR